MMTRCARKLIDSYVYYGAQRTKDARELSRRDVVLTTYETLVRDVMGPFPPNWNQSTTPLDANTAWERNTVLLDTDGLPKSRPISPLLQIKWDRLILDEGHMIKNPSSRRSRAIQALQARARWAVTGTPLQNEMNELYSLMRYLQYNPFNISQVWDECIRNSTKRASTLLKGMMLRRTKTMKGADGLPLVKLPNRTFTVHHLNLTRVEQAIHDTLGNRSKALFKQYIRQRKLRKESGGGSPIDVSYANFLCALLRMRQACCHPYLLREQLDPGSVAVALAGLSIGQQEGGASQQGDLRENAGAAQADENEDGEDPETLNGGKGSLAKTAESAIEAAKEAEILALVEASRQTHSRVLADPSWVSTKIRYTVELLQDIQANRPGDKAVIVSQWTSLLKILEVHLQREGFRYVIIDGSVPQSHRKNIISDFNKNPVGPELMLLSMGAGGVGLNLIGANHLILLDIHWNPAMEAQVCDRVYRVGQLKPVFVHKLLCKGTIEDRVESLQNRKRKLFNAVVVTEQYGTGHDADSRGRGATRAGGKQGSSSSATHLTLDELEMLFS